MALGWGWVERWLPGQRKSSPVQGLSEIKEQPDEGVRVSAVLPDWNQSPRLQSLNKCAKSAKTQPERERTGLGCSYGGGKWGQNRRQRMWQGCLGPGWAAAQEHNTKSARALWVGLPCFCSHGSGMWPPKITEQVPWHDSSECDKLAGQFIRISFVSTSLCSPPDRTERQRKVINCLSTSQEELCRPFPKRLLAVSLKLTARLTLQHTQPFCSVWEVTLTISRQQEHMPPDLSVPPEVIPTLQTLNGEGAWKMREHFCIRNYSRLGYRVFSNIYFSVLINILFEEKYCN